MNRTVFLLIWGWLLGPVFGPGVNILTAQTLSSPAGLFDIDPFQPEQLNIKPLEALIAAALQHSPVLKQQNLRVENLAYEQMIIQREWTKSLSVGGSWLVGSGQFLDATETLDNQAYRLTNRQNAVYNAGVSVKIPIGELFSRGPKLRINQNQIQLELLRKEELQGKLRELIISYYSELMLNIRLMEIKADDLAFNRLAVEQAGQYFREGAMGIDAYTQVVSKKNKAEEELEKIRAQARQSFLLLQELVGADLRSAKPDRE